MKRTVLVLFAALLILGGCQKQTTVDTTADVLASAVLHATPEHEFTRADDDFVESGFDAPEALRESAVYFASDAGETCEFGIFCLIDAARAEDMVRAVRRYLEQERAAVESLSALYPGDELEKRLACYRDALVGVSGNIVYYFAMDSDAVQRAQQSLQSALNA